MVSVREVKNKHIELFEKFGNLLTLKEMPIAGRDEITKIIKEQIEDILTMQDPRIKSLSQSDYDDLDEYLKIYEGLRTRFEIRPKKKLFGVFG